MKSITFHYERELWKRGFLVVGVDEVGRGALAGPIVAAAVAFSALPAKREKITIDDSKKLSSRMRERAEKWIKENSTAFGVGIIGVSAINRVGIGVANIQAMRQALRFCRTSLKHSQKTFVFSDYFHIPYLHGIGKHHQRAIPYGDQRCFSIAAASIIAKVYRDRLMRRLAKRFPEYQWHRNKGYATVEHREGIKKYGPTILHRNLFIRRVMNEN